MIKYGIPIYSQVKDAERAIEALMRGTVVPDEIVIIDNSEKDLVARTMLSLKGAPIRYIRRDKNILSGAWNDFMHLGTDSDYMIMANDDLTVHENTLEELIRAADNNLDIAMFNGSIHAGNSYSFYLLRKWAYDMVGPFDEKFIPAYYEDNDYDYRLCKIHGLKRIHVETVTFDHVKSATTKNMNTAQQQQHHINFRRNQRYYVSKWGGMPGNEKYLVAFAGVDLSDI
jgi:GT2 family glycosyltransferase